ncbi:MAG: four-carbon acid sugar kinase family protein [Erysipelotrichaceae bacterium]
MTKILILADDLTGALDSGVQLARKGAYVKVITNYTYKIELPVKDIDVVVINTETRHLSKEEAYSNTFRVLKDLNLEGIDMIYKKTDSVLRGNIGAELEAVMKATGKNHIQFIPAYPKLGRTTKNGIHYIYGTPISDSIFSKDLRNPITESNVTSIIHQQSDVPVILSDEENRKEGIILHDCCTNQQLEEIYKKLEKQNDLSLLAGCAGFMEMVMLNTKKYKDHLCEIKVDGIKEIIVLCGTTNPVSLKQLEYAEIAGANYIRVSMFDIVQENNWREKFDIELKNFLIKKSRIGLKIIGTTADVIHFEKASQQIADGFGYIAKRVLKNSANTVLMVIGGDTLLSVMKELNVECISPKCELFPGVVLSEFCYENKNRYLISKSGGFGSPQLLIDIFKKLT